MDTAAPFESTVRSRFVLLHGWQNRRPRRHWQRWLAGQLRADGHDVHYPQLPDPDRPVLKDWLTAISVAVDGSDARPTTVICHSLSCVAWTHLADSGNLSAPVARVLFVAPPSPGFIDRQPELSDFVFDTVPPDVIASSSRTTPRLVCSTDDPYCPEGAARRYRDVFDIDELTGAGHLDMVAGYGEWPSILNWCRDPLVRLVPRPDRSRRRHRLYHRMLGKLLQP